MRVTLHVQVFACLRGRLSAVGSACGNSVRVEYVSDYVPLINILFVSSCVWVCEQTANEIRKSLQLSHWNGVLRESRGCVCVNQTRCQKLGNAATNSHEKQLNFQFKKIKIYCKITHANRLES